ncbi:hypothetical protein LTR48_001447 [Friedmanniomyces endolithicus]|uniref:C2H2-type domain-containing protein n=1 Tax=Rachicladosporium monterosium TaxID=1507873 RepID=A0ABR0L658_9PEZI|nr:hypothetical protein LTR48_001447 [Friedmanniomyces endolithicus]KAK5144108.1 hypothetical protein LTR32_003901 [Rachicladosporium monterosium]
MCLLHGESRTFSQHDGLQAHCLRVHGLHLGSPSDTLSTDYKGTINSPAQQLPSRSSGLFANSTLKPLSRSRGFTYFGPRTHPVFDENDSDGDCEDPDVDRHLVANIEIGTQPPQAYHPYRNVSPPPAAELAAMERSQARMTWNALSADTPMASMLERGTAPSRVGKGNGESYQGASNGDHSVVIQAKLVRWKEVQMYRRRPRRASASATSAELTQVASTRSGSHGIEDRATLDTRPRRGCRCEPVVEALAKQTGRQEKRALNADSDTDGLFEQNTVGHVDRAVPVDRPGCADGRLDGEISGRSEVGGANTGRLGRLGRVSLASTLLLVSLADSRLQVARATLATSALEQASARAPEEAGDFA